MGVHELPLQQGLYDPSYEHDNCGLGFIADTTGRKSHEIVDQALQILRRLKHRGATGSDGTTGDGAGIMLQIPHEFLSRETTKIGFCLPETGQYALGMLFLPREPHARLFCEGVFERVAREEGLPLLGWREVPVDERACGTSGRATRPAICQVFFDAKRLDQTGLDLTLLRVRKRAQNQIAAANRPYMESFYPCSLSTRTLVYKGQVQGEDLARFFPDLADPLLASAIAVVHERYSTNTFPQWRLAHPFRLLAHNGEINTIQGNVNWMNAREELLCRNLTGLRPIIEPGGSDSSTLDNVLEFLMARGFPMEKAMMILVPEAWQEDTLMPEDLKAFYEYHALLMEPWDGPAALVFTDGLKVGARADRNGLRPLRYSMSQEGLVVMASEAGVLDLPPESVIRRGILGPGQMLLVDTTSGETLHDEDLQRHVTSDNNYRDWLDEHRHCLTDLPESQDERRMNPKLLAIRKRCFGFSESTIRNHLLPMARDGKEPIGSMGDDRPIAALSEAPKAFCEYFRQAFAQVTNPPIDPIRERSVMSLRQYLGGPEALCDVTFPTDKEALALDSPILDNRQMSLLRALNGDPLRSTVLPITFPTDGGPEELERALETLCDRAERCVREDFDVLILSDRNIGLYSAPIPCLLALGAVHQHLVRQRLRTRVDLVVEGGGICDVMHVALLLGYGAKAVNPYLALETLRHLESEDSTLKTLPPGTGRTNYVGALDRGLLKVMAKMGISTLQSYHGAQIFEVLGLAHDLVERHFTGTPVALSGIGLDIICRDLVEKHSRAYLNDIPPELPPNDDFLLDGSLARKLREACRTGSYAAFLEFSETWEKHKRSGVLRGLLEARGNQPVDLEEVDPVENLLPRLGTGAISLGAISPECHETLAIAMNRIGGQSNSGEGGENPQRDLLQEGRDNLCSTVRQVASGRFGVDIRYLSNCREIQIKMGQGAKPGEGGHLPGRKVSTEVARLRHCKPGQPLISPPPHHDIYSIEDLAQLIHDLRRANPDARISVKLAARTGIGTIAAGVVKAKADAIAICGHDGGTGAAPVSSMRYVGLPWEIGLAEVQQTLLLNNLRDRIALQADGRIANGYDVIIAALLGAEEFGLTTASIVATGCLMCRQCSRNECPVGIATQSERLRSRFQGRPEHVINYFRFVARQVREIMANLGFRRFEDLVGRVGLLHLRKGIRGKAASLDLAPILYLPELPSRIGRRQATDRPRWEPDPGLDELILKSPAVGASRPIVNTDRSVGTRLSGALERSSDKALARDNFLFVGTAGQSFGAFLRSGLTFKLVGEANDYVGKGLAGGRIIVSPPDGQLFAPSENVIAGNTILYGATAGEAYLGGRCGERFAVRNSGALAVCEGIGNHGCEYMTGGTVIVLGPVGCNFGAGMTGGEAFVLDREGDLPERCHAEGLQINKIPKAGPEPERLKAFLVNHYRLTDSPLARDLLREWRASRPLFRHITPKPTASQ